MSQPETAGEKAVLSDPVLPAEVRRYGRFDPTGCYQCGTCTITCDLVRGSASFPRRIMRYALLGLREPLDASVEPWLCHDCGDCSIACPRQADPRASMQTLRHYLIGRYDWTGLAARVMRSKAWYLGTLIFVAALTLALIVFYHLWYVEMTLEGFLTTRRGLSHMIPTMTYFTLVVVLLPFFLVASNAFRMWWLTMGRGPTRIPLRHYAAEIWMYVVQSVTHEKMRKCAEKTRWPKHWMMALGMVAKLVIIVFFLSWFQKNFAISQPQAWVGYLVTALLLYGTMDVLIGRLRKKKEIYKYSEMRDYVFPVLLLLTVLSGLAANTFRYVDLKMAAHYAYAIHIAIATPMLVIEIPFGKWSHMVYRPLALYLQAVKERAAAPQVAPGKAEAEHA